jgi:preprotein translocase subunit YajC
MKDQLAWLPLGQMTGTTGTGPAVEPRTTAATPAASPAPAVTNSAGPAATVGATPSTPPTTNLDNGKAVSSPYGIVLPIILMFGVLYFVLFRGQRKEEKRRKGLIAELKKGDRVMTIGGLVARVVSIDGDEVVLKIDESANVKATYRKSSIQEVLTGEEKK